LNKTATKTSRKKHVRRSPEEAKAKILEACAKILREEGPEALKLDRIAKVSGYTSPVALHHFGSASNVKKALILQMMENMLKDLNLIIQESGERREAMWDIAIEELFDFYKDPVYIKLITWLVSTNQTSALRPLEEPMRKQSNDLKNTMKSFGREQMATPELLASLFFFQSMTALGMAIGRSLMPKEMLDLIPSGEMEKWVAEVLANKTGGDFRETEESEG